MEKGQISKVFGQRMKQSRELCNLSQKQAARVLGYKNTSYLSKIESGEYTSSVKPELLIKAAQIYEVSCDYLLGITDEWERDPHIASQKKIEGWLLAQWNVSKSNELAAVGRISKKIDCIENSIKSLVPSTKKCHASLLDFIRLNPRFEYMKGGACLQNSILEADRKATEVGMSLRRYNQDTTQIQQAVQLELPLINFMVFR